MPLFLTPFWRNTRGLLICLNRWAMLTNAAVLRQINTGSFSFERRGERGRIIRVQLMFVLSAIQKAEFIVYFPVFRNALGSDEVCFLKPTQVISHVLSVLFFISGGSEILHKYRLWKPESFHQTYHGHGKRGDWTSTLGNGSQMCGVSDKRFTLSGLL